MKVRGEPGDPALNAADADEERRAGVQKRIRDLSEGLTRMGVNPTDARLGEALGLNASTVARWRAGGSLPKRRAAEALAVLARIVRYATGDPPGQTPAVRESARAILRHVLHEGWTIRGLSDAVLVSEVSFLVPSRSETR